MGADNKGRPCSDNCRLYDDKCLCRLISNDEFSECKTPRLRSSRKKGFTS